LITPGLATIGVIVLSFMTAHEHVKPAAVASLGAKLSLFVRWRFNSRSTGSELVSTPAFKSIGLVTSTETAAVADELLDVWLSSSLRTDEQRRQLVFKQSPVAWTSERFSTKSAELIIVCVAWSPRAFVKSNPLIRDYGKLRNRLVVLWILGLNPSPSCIASAELEPIDVDSALKQFHGVIMTMPVSLEFTSLQLKVMNALAEGDSETASRHSGQFSWRDSIHLRPT
jgi:hypothetical protein